ncbi:MAG: cation:proton antiporter [Hyphomicrobiales bacterium]
MEGHGTDLTEAALVVSLAVTLGFIFARIKLPAIIAYIIAGAALGPTGLRFISKTEEIQDLAEMGVLMLLFLIGMELSIRAFISVLKPAALVALGQLVAAMVTTAIFGLFLDWPFSQVLVLAFIVALSSTAVAIKMLDEMGELRTTTGRITVGVMIAQDIAVVPMLILTQSLGGEGSVTWLLAVKIIFAIGLLAYLLYWLGKPGKLNLPFTDVVENRPDMMALAMVAFCFTSAALSGFAGLSAAYGAFVAGLVIASSSIRSKAIEVTHPIQSVLLFIFFLSIGLLLDLEFIAENWKLVTLYVAGVILVKTILNVGLIRRAGFSWDVAVPAGLSMAQIGEFSFILAAVALRHRALDLDSYRLALSVIAMSLMVSPIWIAVAKRFHEAAQTGVTDFREALREAYPNEMAGIKSNAHRARVLTKIAMRTVKKRAARKKALSALHRAEAAAGLATAADHDDEAKPKRKKK